MRWVFAGSSLAIIWTAPMCTQLGIALDKPIDPVLAYRLSATLSKQSVGHISHVVSPTG